MTKFNSLAALKLVRIGVTDELSQCFQVFATRNCLIVLFDKRIGLVDCLPNKGLIIGMVSNERNVIPLKPEHPLFLSHPARATLPRNHVQKNSEPGRDARRARTSARSRIAAGLY